ncbi:hypothetical protein BSL78_29605 [Apostichopus japonicus]|uniref:Integrase catalytic domain-containing protein n=1 Tax=Stichopus japonicus TaxID=307972 RepID=A0A2G8JCW4_STIJA|nr:hypothetical protein BSL78_29605 [Apostichopus japonicus]
MTPPSNKTELQQFLGMMTYLSSFVKDFSSKTSTLRDLLKANTEFLWEAHHQSTFNQLKQEISASSLLLYYASEEPVYLQCDASLKGLGVALLQKNGDGFLQPVAYASKSLTQTEQSEVPNRELGTVAEGNTTRPTAPTTIRDHYTKYLIIRKIPGNCSSHAVIIAMKQVFSEHGKPEKVVSDNGPQFASELFKQFASGWSFDHVTSSPRRPQGNGFIERQVRTAKSILTKAKQSNTDIHMAFTNVENNSC